MANLLVNKWKASKENREIILITKTKPDDLHITYLLSVLSAWNAEIVTYPLELIKTRLQIQGEAADERHVKSLEKVRKRGMFKTGIGIIREEGLFKLWHGVQSALFRHSIYSGLRVMLYKKFKDEFSKRNAITSNKSSSNNSNSDGMTLAFPLWQSLTCTIGACTIAQVLSNPADLAKTQLQMEGKRRLIGLEPRVHGLFHALRTAYVRSGFFGLWNGTVPNIQRAILVGIGDITAYDMSKQFIVRHTSLEDGPAVHFMGSMCAGFVAAAMGTPADVIKTRIMNQPLAEDGKGKYYKGPLDCLLKAVREEGPLSMYKGFMPTWLRMCPWALTFWLSYEQYAKLLGAQHF